MSEVYGGDTAASGENEPSLQCLTLTEMSKVLIELGGTLHCSYSVQGLEFQSVKWYDPEEIDKYYIIEQAVRPTGSFNYNLRVFCGDTVTEWYDYQDGLVRVNNRLCNYAEELRLDLQRMEYEHAADCLRAELTRRNYTPPLAPLDVLRGNPITETENKLFFAIVNGFAK